MPRMRMRRKKNLESRLEACSDYLIPAETDDLNFSTAAEQKDYIDCAALFGREAPVYLEIGCGKGQFITELAQRHPENNYLAVEKVGNVIVSAAERAKELRLPNVLFMKTGAEYLARFLPPQSISGIYLNFSCPFPKHSHRTHRLTHRRFLAIYRTIMKPDAFLYQKTDNMHFFEFSIEELSKSGFVLQNLSLDLHSSDFEGNIVTEYESRFVAEGKPIYRLEAYLSNPEQGDASH